MIYKPGDMVIAKCKRRMGRHAGRVVEATEEDMIITNGYETVHITMFNWEVRDANN